MKQTVQSVYYFLFSIWTFSESAIITPNTIEDVCPNDMVNLTCSVTGVDILGWDLPTALSAGNILVRFFDDDTDRVGMRTVLQNGPYAVTLDSVAPNMLTSTLEVTLLDFLNDGTIVCSGSSIVIQFQDLPNTPVNLQLAQTINNSTVTVQWDPPQSNEPPVENYTVSVTPTPMSGEATSVVTQTHIEFVLDYNQPYIVQVVATNCMGTNNTAATITFTLVRCDDPPDPINGQVATIVGMNRTEGSTVTLMCDDGYTPVGDISSTCTSNMTWEPNPALFECRPVSCSLPLEPTNGAIKDYDSFNQTVEEGTMLTYQCDSGLSLTGPMTIRCTNDGEWSDDPQGIMCVTNAQGTSAPLITIAAAVGITLAVSAVVFTILGFLAGLLVMYLITRKKTVYSPTEGQANLQPTVPAGPVYDKVSPAPNQQIELNTNSAYGPVTPGPVYEDVLSAPKDEIELKTTDAYGPVRQ